MSACVVVSLDSGERIVVEADIDVMRQWLDGGAPLCFQSRRTYSNDPRVVIAPQHVSAVIPCSAEPNGG